ncbi:PKD domain-containing protein [Flavobacterium tegetincola]|uniref:PKD domain-containing protein n=1 Tax=Flavobacterium tegetincola TaxID=150172 RepID=UPI00041CBF7B|nr:PKD domain-containing protein [Flavobacterium tegetincola]
MNQKSLTKQKMFFVLTLFTLLLGGILKSQAQSSSGVTIGWNISVGCQDYSEDRKEVFIEQIQVNEHIKVCRNSSVKYTLSPLPTGSTTVWTVSGGTKSLETNQSVTVNWTGIGTANVTFTITTPTGILTNSLPINIIQGPSAAFDSTPFTVNQTIYACANQQISFNDLSNPNGSSAIVSYLWDFGDGDVWDGQLASHSYDNPGTYYVQLKVTNQCNCTSTTKTRVIIDKKGFDIICASIVCEKQTVTYSLPAEATSACGGFNWSVIGGTIVGSDHAPTVNVIWDQVDQNGFGYITFTPSQCSLPCVFPTTAKIPVIKSVGTITGNTSLCLGQQGNYKLPPWPTTDIEWHIVGNTSGNFGTIIQTDQRNEIVLTPLQAGTITLVALYNNTLVHCGGKATLTINVSSPEPFNGESAVCLGTATTYTTVSGNNVNWTLRSVSGTIITPVTFGNSFSYSFTAVGNYTLTVSGSGICEGQTKNINVAPALQAPVLTTPLTTIVCLNAPYTYSVANPAPNDQYEWIVDSNATIIGSSTGSEINVIFQGNSQLKVRKIQQSPSNCSSPFTVINVTQLTIDADISNTTAVVTQMSACSNNFFTYNAVNTTGGIYVNTNNASTFEWSVNPSTAGSITSGQGTATVEVLWNNVTGPQNYHLELVIKKCTTIKTISKLVIVSPIPSISITNNATVCSGNQLLFTVDSTIPLVGATIQWDFGNGETQLGNPGAISIQHPFENGSGANIGYTVTATIVNANNCAGTLTASSNYVITPGPSATASYSTGGNTFCYEYQINATLTASVTTGSTIAWYYGVDVATGTQVQTGPSLNVTYAGGFTFGNYFFVATKNGCSTKSNNLYIYQDCGPLPPCTIASNPQLTFTATNACGTITLTGSYTGTPTAVRFTIIGPGVSLLDVPGNQSTNLYVLSAAKAGIYHVFYKVTYISTTGTQCTISESRTVTVPYVADFKINATCNSSDNVDNYLVTLTNYSNFLGTVTTPQFKYERVTSSGTLITVLSNWSATQNITNLPLAPGTHYFRQSIRGKINGVWQTVCSTINSIELTSMNGLSIDFQQPLCFDTAVEFGVQGTDNLGYTFLWTFENPNPGIIDPVTNTNPKPLRLFDASFAGSQVMVTLNIKNKYGCTRTLTALVTIPNKCFSGTLTSTPPDATVCKGTPLLLSYSPGTLPTECGVTNYIWMKDNVVIQGETASTYLAYTPGFYTVKVFNGTCEYTSPNVISPIFTPLPSLTLNGPTTLCEGDSASFSVTTNAIDIQWTIDGIPNTALNGETSISLPNLSAGTYEVSVKVTANGCDKEATQSFEVISVPAAVVISTPVLVNCQSYTIKLTAYAPGIGTYNWSNGQVGVSNPDGSNTITVNQGGAYMVTFSNALNCSTAAQVYVPKSPKAYMWVFPTGCYSKCKDEVASLLGPTLPVNAWSWLLNQSPLLSGTNSVPASLPLTQSGTYNLQLNTGLCNYTSESMSLSASTCADCKVGVKVKKIILNGSPFCASTLTLEITNSNPSFQASIVSNTTDLIVMPGSINVANGTHLYTSTILPINGFLGGTVNMSLIGTIVKEEIINCATPFTLNVPSCNTAQARTGTETNVDIQDLAAKGNITLYPNPATNQVNIRFETEQSNSQVEVYDLTGRLIANFEATATQGVWELDLAPMATGVYVVVLRQGGTILMQRKLQVLQ